MTFRPQRLFIITDCFSFVNNFFKFILTFFNVVSFVFLSFPTAKIILPDVSPNVNSFFKFFQNLKMSTLKSTFFHVFIVLPFCTIRSLFYCVFSLLGSAVLRLPLLPASHAPCIRCYASCFTSSLNNSPAEW